MGDYGEKASADLIVTRGDGFRKEKNKKKRGSYRGGEITVSILYATATQVQLRALYRWNPIASDSTEPENNIGHHCSTPSRLDLTYSVR